MAKAYKALPSAGDLWDLFSYNPLTGVLYRRKHREKRYIGAPFGCPFSNGYIVGEIHGSAHSAHRLIWKWCTGEDPTEIDHINHNRADNRIWNLRCVTRSGNHCNRSGVRGWYRHRSGRYHALIGIHGKQRYLGSYATPEEARAAYDAAAAKLHAPLLESGSMGLTR